MAGKKKSPRTVGIIGHPIRHTASPAMHNAAFRRLKLDWEYQAFDVPPKRLAPALRRLEKAGLAGLNVTVPHKARAARLVGNLDPAAKKIGAINTIVFSRPSRGFNTDGPGLIAALRSELGFRPRGKTVAIAGCGGAGQAAAVSIALAGAKKIILLNRTRSKARALGARVRQIRPAAKISLFAEPCDLLINATSLGLRESDPLPLSLEELRMLKPRRFMDMIYRPAVTPLMRKLRSLGAQTSNGLEMLLQQGARSFEIWTGRRAPVSTMRRALKNEIYRRRT